MKQEVVDLILKDLPNQTAGVLRDYIDKAAKLEKENETLKSKIQKLEEDSSVSEVLKNELVSEIDRLECAAGDVKTQKEINDKHLLDIEKRERDMKLTIAQIYEAQSERRADDIKELAAILVRNTTFKKKTLSQTPVERQNMSNQYNNQTGCYEDIPNGGTYVENVETIEKETKIEE